MKVEELVKEVRKLPLNQQRIFLQKLAQSYHGTRCNECAFMYTCETASIAGKAPCLDTRVM